MQAYHNDIKIKEKYIARMKAHIAADELIRGVGFNTQGKGCAVGCTLNKYSHKDYEIELGIPEWLAYIEDKLFEQITIEKSQTFPLLFLENINVGCDLDKIKPKFMIYLLESTLTYFDNKQFVDAANTINTVITLYKNNELDKNKWLAAGEAAEAESWSAAMEAMAKAVGSAAWSVVSSASWAAHTAWAAAHTACVASTAGMAVVYTAHTAYAARAAVKEAQTNTWELAYDKYADKLLTLIQECK